MELGARLGRCGQKIAANRYAADRCDECDQGNQQDMLEFHQPPPSSVEGANCQLSSNVAT